jgi:predicted nucleic acid-binding protein
VRATAWSFSGGCVVDASVVVKVFLPEEGSEAATDLLQGSGSPIDPRAAPDLIYLECANIFWKRARRGLLSPDDAQAMLRDLLALPLRIWPPEDLAERALGLALSLDITAYDAAYLGLAEQLDVPLITADENLVRKLGGPTERLRLLGS